MSIEDSVAGQPAWGSPVVLAKVEAVDGASLRVCAPSLGHAAARLAAPGYRPVPGDRVLVAVADDGWRYVVGVVGALRTAPDAEGEVRASDGAHARVERTDEGEEVLALRDGEGRLLVAHRPAQGRTEIHAPGTSRCAPAEI